jgi:ABC-type nitrate/sulfonate/bicarbonate transport system substrate-binding protein
MKKPCGLVAIAFAAAFACIAGAHAQEKARVAYAVQIHQANMMLLQEYGRKHGVEIELTPMRHYTNLQLALTTNQVDIAAMGYVNIGLMEELGFRDYKVIAGVFTGAQSLTLRNGVTASTWKDLEGKSIGVAPNSYADILFRSSAKLGGADLSKIKLVSFGPGGPQVIAALRNGDIDGFVFWEPNNAEAALSKAGHYSSLDLGKNPTRHINGMLAVSSGFAASKKNAVLGVVKSWSRRPMR